MTNKKDIEERVIKVIREVTGKKDMEIKSEDSLIDDLELDSIDFASLIMSLEDEFGGTVEDEDAPQLMKVNSIVDYIAKREIEAS